MLFFDASLEPSSGEVVKLLQFSDGEVADSDLRESVYFASVGAKRFQMASFARNSFNPNKKPSDPERWICIYPAYIDSNKTRVDGRRVPKSRAVDKPTCSEICDVLTAANFKVGVEPKFYPREPSKEDEMRGRVRVQLKNEDGTPVNPAFPSRDSVLLYIGEKIPHLKSRVFKSGGDGQSANQGGGGKKKGKGGRR